MDTANKEPNKNINDQILQVVKGFIDYFEEVEEEAVDKEGEKA